MPTYEYACKQCECTFETVQSIKENALTECPKCHAQSLERLISGGTSFSLKGEGWYKDLYSSPKPQSSQ